MGKRRPSVSDKRRPQESPVVFTEEEVGRVLEAVAFSVARDYQTVRRVYEAKVSGAQSSYKVDHSKGIWKKLARKCLKNEVDWYRYILWYFDTNLAAFSNNRSSNSTVVPNWLLSDKKLKQFLEEELDRNKIVAEKSSLLKSRTNTLKDKLTQYEAAGSSKAKKLALLDPVFDSSPLFQYCVALDEGYTEIADNIFDQAVVEFLRCPSVYVEAWRDLIPGFLRALHKKLVRRL